jgi:ABC-2 type transport system permease protein
MTGAGPGTPSTPPEDTAMTATLTAAPIRPPVRATRPSLPTLVGLEVRKSLSTRSGRSVALAAVLLAPAAMAVASLSGDAIGSAAGPVGAVGLLSAMLLLALGVLSTAGEWSHRTVQTTFLLVPNRTKVMASKVVGVAVMGAVLAALASALTMAVLMVAPVGDPSWAGVPMAVAVSVAAGAAFAVIGAGTGAALANTPAALTGLYLIILGAMPAMRIWKPEVADALDPSNAVLQLATGNGTTGNTLTLVGWVVVTTVVGTVVTRRRAVS